MAEQVYKSLDMKLQNAGVTARFARDASPESTFITLESWDFGLENALVTRLGTFILNAGGQLPAAVNHSLGRMRSLSAQYRYVGNGTNLYRSSTAGINWSQINGAVSLSASTPWTQITYRPDFSAFPWSFFADRNAMLKDNGSLGTAQTWGYFAPTRLPSATVLAGLATLIQKFDVDAGFTYPIGFAGHAAVSQVNTTLTTAVAATGYRTVGVVNITNIKVGSWLVINQGSGNEETVYVSAITGNSFSANFLATHIAGETVKDSAITGSFSAAGTDSAIDFAPPGTDWRIAGNASARDLICLQVRFGDPSKIVGANITITTSTGVGTYSIDVDPGDTIFPNSPAGDWFQWTVSRGSFATTSGTIDWANVSEVFIRFTIDFTAVALTLGINGMGVVGGGPDVTGGTPYDYRITGFNNNTGGESNGSQTWIDTKRVSPVNQQVRVTWTDPSDPQYTHVRIYRRGGGLTDGWYQVGQVAIGVGVFTDNVPDFIAALGNRLALDNDPPVTSSLQTPINATLSASVSAGAVAILVATSSNQFQRGMYVTVGTGSTQETVIIEAVGGFNITAYFQYAHSSGDSLTANAVTGFPVYISAVANDRVWLAGDAGNPNVIYYSKPKNAEAFPPQNTLEVGTPGDPIMALIPSRGLLWIFTSQTVYGVVITGSTPYSFPTGVKHGLFSSYAWTLGDGGEIYYLGQDGIYVFNGSASTCISDEIEWYFQLRPSAYTGGIQPDNMIVQYPGTYRSHRMAFFQGQLFFLDPGTSFTGYFLVYDVKRKRWRVWTHGIFESLMAEPDTTQLVAGGTDGNYYQLCNGFPFDKNFAGTILPFTATLQTTYQDFGMPDNEKVMQNLVLDIDTAGQDVTLSLFWNNTTANVLNFTVNQNGRAKVRIPVNAGKGQVGYNFSIKLNASVSAQISVWQLGMEVLVEPIYRKAFDTFWLNFGSDGFKFVHQVWIEYLAPAALDVACYLDGSDTATYTFTLPASTTRTEVRKQLPAFKGKQWRYVITSAQPFKLYPLSRIEWKPVDITSGYQMENLAVS